MLKTPQNTRRLARRSHALTLVEVMIAIALLQIVVLGISYTLATGEKHVEEANYSQRATRLAIDLIEEIVSKSYDDPDGAAILGIEIDELTRQQYDDMDDYNGHGERAGALTDFSATAYSSEYQVFSRTATVTSTSMTVSGLSHTTDGKYIVVTVSDRSGRQWSISRFVPEQTS